MTGYFPSLRKQMRVTAPALPYEKHPTKYSLRSGVIRTLPGDAQQTLVVVCTHDAGLNDGIAKLGGGRRKQSHHSLVFQTWAQPALHRRNFGAVHGGAPKPLGTIIHDSKAEPCAGGGGVWWYGGARMIGKSSKRPTPKCVSSPAEHTYTHILFVFFFPAVKTGVFCYVGSRLARSMLFIEETHTSLTRRPRPWFPEACSVRSGTICFFIGHSASAVDAKRRNTRTHTHSLAHDGPSRGPR